MAEDRSSGRPRPTVPGASTGSCRQSSTYCAAPSGSGRRACRGAWQTITYVDLVFTTPTGGIVLRQTIAKVVKQAAKTAGIADTAQLGTHAGRRSVVTTLFVDGGETLEDIARLVGHAKPAMTAGYVKRLGRRPQEVAERAAAVLDGQADAADEGSESPGDLGSNRGSYGSGSAGDEANDDEP
jgi:hypothetical protein